MSPTPTRARPEAAGKAPAPPRPREGHRRGRRSWGRRLLITANVFVALCVLATAGAYGYFQWQFGRIPKFSFDKGVLREEGGDDRPMNVLLVGSDSREDIDPSEAKSFGTTRQVGGQRSDTMIVLRVDPEAKKAAMLSVPRDLMVDIAGTGDRDRINTAFDRGADRLIATITQSLSIPIDHYAQVDFNGFRGIVEAVGGVTIRADAPARDKVSGLDIRTPGCVSLDGNQALAFVRSRNYEFFESGRWHDDPTADLGRIQRQQDFIRRAMKKAIQKGARNPNVLRQLINAGIKNVKIDEGFDPDEIIRVGNRFRSLEPDDVEMLTVPTVMGRERGMSVLKLKQPEAQQVIDRFLGKVPPPADAPGGGSPAIPPESIRVRVLNGSGAAGQAATASEALQGVGFNVAGTGDADAYSYGQTVVRFGTGQRAKAAVLHSLLKGGARLVEDRTVKGVDLVLVTGADFRGVTAGQGGSDAAPPPAAPGGAKPEPKGAPPQREC